MKMRSVDVVDEKEDKAQAFDGHDEHGKTDGDKDG